MSRMTTATQQAGGDARAKFRAAYHDRRAWVRAFHAQVPGDHLFDAMTFNHDLPYWQAAANAATKWFDPSRYSARLRLAVKRNTRAGSP